MRKILIRLNDVNKIYNGELLLSHIDLTIEDRDRIGLIGVNGCGKSTLLKLITGQLLPDHITDGDGEIAYSGSTTVGYLEQMSGLDRENTVWAEMKGVFSKLLAAQEKMNDLAKQFDLEDSNIAEEYHRLQSWFESNDGYQIDVKIKTVLNGMGFGEECYDRIINGFSGGEKTRLAIAKLLLEEPNLLILDEPTNHLDFKTVMWLEDYLKDYKGALLIVSHDRYFLDRLCTSICEIERKKLTRYKGNYTAYTVLKEAMNVRQMKEYEMQQKEISKLEDYIAKNKTRASTAKSAQSRIKQLEKIERIEKPLVYHKQARVHFEYDIDPPQQLLQVQDIDISVGEGANRKTLVSSLSFEVRRGEKWGIIGDNGIGKSTLLKEIQGILPHNGRVKWTSNVKRSYFEQESTNLDPNKTIMQEIHDRVPSWTDLQVRSLLGQVRITGEDVYKQIGVISGGERAKVCFAVMMIERGNVLILDEPTNHLDISMKEVIEEALVEFGGTILFVSHDRYLLDKVADNILEITEDEIRLYKGGFSNWLSAEQQHIKEQKSILIENKQQHAREKLSGDKSSYRSKQQRAIEAKQRSRKRELEKLCDELQEELERLTEETASEDVYTNFELMQEKCSRMEEIRQQTDEALEELILIEEELG